MDDITLEPKQKLKDFRAVCLKTGAVLAFYYICTIAVQLVGAWFKQTVSLPYNAMFGIGLVLSSLFQYLLPITFAVLLLKFHPDKTLFTPPQKKAKAMGNLTAVYGIGQGVNLLTVVVFFALSKFLPDVTFDVNDAFRGIATGDGKGLTAALMMAFVGVIVAPICEEFLIRGVIMRSLMPYGSGFAIIVSSVMFGFMHGNFHQLFYTLALGLALGFIAYTTGSILTSVIMHMCFNAVGMGFLVFQSVVAVERVPEAGAEELLYASYGMFQVLIVALAIAGVWSFFKRIPKLKLVQFVDDFTVLSTPKKYAVLLTSFTVIIAIALAVDAHAGNFLAGKLTETLFPTVSV
ncbi:MAG: CPBP family intramembrane metalloprotease [Oscillospiraceae bacterium]|nr:CPBP family intramembrane metalloprotease [Oscillospiraceae bacterium]